jgi:hypothetical protein
MAKETENVLTKLKEDAIRQRDSIKVEAECRFERLKEELQEKSQGLREQMERLTAAVTSLKLEITRLEEDEETDLKKMKSFNVARNSEDYETERIRLESNLQREKQDCISSKHKWEVLQLGNNTG